MHMSSCTAELFLDMSSAEQDLVALRGLVHDDWSEYEQRRSARLQLRATGTVVQRLKVAGGAGELSRTLKCLRPHANNIKTRMQITISEPRSAVAVLTKTIKAELKDKHKWASNFNKVGFWVNM